MNPPAIPRATYRLQFNRDFTFAQATEIVPYLAALGISHVYASPYLRARPGSTHGYDIIDHNQLNPEIGSPEEFERFVETLHRHGMGQILDIVPNHMGVMGSDNLWWLDVLENGEISDFAQFFDIDWHPLKDELQGKVLVPVLDDQYGTILDKGQLELKFDATKGEFSIWFHQHRFPIDPNEYQRILKRPSGSSDQTAPPQDADVLELESMISAFGHLPSRSCSTSEEKAERSRDKEIHKRRLADLCSRSVHIAELVNENVRILNGVPGAPGSFDELHELIKAQAFRLAYWRVAADDINYRRFFDINDLAGLRMENPAVFEATHRTVMQWVGEGKINGLRIDHPDGLFNPAEYCERLQRCSPGYVVIEKILGRDEPLPTWPVSGTTGYDFSNLVNGLFVETASAAKMVRAYRGFLGQSLDYQSIIYACKTIVMDKALASELNVLANLLSRIALSNRHTCDFTLNSLREALAEIVAYFPVYRTYLTPGRVSDKDRWYIETAICKAKRNATSQDTSVYDFIRQVLLANNDEETNETRLASLLSFAMKFQQFTSPVMAKGLEDTCFYRYHPLISVNDVGGDPLEFGVTLDDFHRKTMERARTWPHSMLATSTHDSKLSEDVRARINVLSEIPARWRLKARQWRLLNQNKKKMIDGAETPSRNDEYLFYQAMLGVWPAAQEFPADELRERLKQYMLKAAREAKQRTSWANQNSEYENALSSFVDDALQADNRDFIADFTAFQKEIARIGLCNSLSQILIKLTAPGVPDIYQGNEIGNFVLVDPDNRRPVNYRRRRQLLEELTSATDPGTTAKQLAARLQKGEDVEGCAKLFLTWKALSARRAYAELFENGTYIPLVVEGPRAANLVAFARRYEDTQAVVAVPRMSSRLLEEGGSLSDPDFWQNTQVVLPAEAAGEGYRNLITAESHAGIKGDDGRSSLGVSSLMANFPWVLLISE